MFEIEARGGLGRRGTWTRGDRTLPTPLVLFLHRSYRPAPTYAEALFVSERIDDSRVQVRVRGSYFGPRIGNHPDDLPPTKGMPLSMADLEIPEDGAAAEFAIVAGELDLPKASGADAVFLANGPEFQRSPREFVGAMERVRESLGPAKVAAVTGLASPSNLSILVYAGIDVVDSSRMMLDSARGLFHTSAGVVPVSEADRAACGCPACTTGGDLQSHNDHALHREVLLVRNHLSHGRLRELVERRLANAPWNTAVGPPPHLRGGDLGEAYTAVAGGARVASSPRTPPPPPGGRLPPRNPERHRKPPPPRILLLPPCSPRKPLPPRRRPRRFRDAILASANPSVVHEVIVTSPLGLIPRELERFH